jgi:hypothetical protein
MHLLPRSGQITVLSEACSADLAVAFLSKGEETGSGCQEGWSRKGHISFTLRLRTNQDETGSDLVG